jgi:SAM-dependent methyltransferase
VNLADHVPPLLMRARALLRLPGGPADELSGAEIGPAARAVEKLHEGLVGARALARAATYDDPAHLGAYLLWWWPQSYLKVCAALAMARLPLRPRILDLGAGPGPAAIAALDALGGEALAFDASAAALAEARALQPALRTQQGDLARELPEGEFDLTLAANVLSELAPARRAALVREGTTVLIEPALRETGRALLELRDQLLASGFRALAPCLTQKPCPALASPKDWCTAELRWTPPRHVTQLADATGLRADELLSFAPLILARTAPQPEAGAWRVVGVPPPEKGKKRLWICSDEGRVAVGRLDKHERADNAQFDQLGRGDLVRLGGLERRGDGLRLVPGATVERLK